MKNEDEDKIMYEVRANNWFNTAMEFDKQILWLSAGSIAILLNIDNFVFCKNIITLFYTLSIICFIITIISVLRVYKLNRNYLLSLLDKDENNEVISSTKISFWDFMAIINIVIGVLFLILFFIFNNIS